MTRTIHDLPLVDIVVMRDDRQRREIDVSDLLPSIEQWGVIQPIVVRLREDGRAELVAGERRYTASKALGLSTIPAVMWHELEPVDAKRIELEENVKRSDLPWRDYVRAVGEIHTIYSNAHADWNQTKTAQAINIASSHLSPILRVFRDIDSPLLEDCTSLRAAANKLQRYDERHFQSVMGAVFDTTAEVTADVIEQTERPVVPEAPADLEALLGEVPQVVPPRPALVPSRKPDPIQNVSFLDWAPKYEGPRFNLIHCDFPYGINFNAGSQGGRNDWSGYDDSPEVYWELCMCLCENAERLFLPSAHLVFWFSMDYYTDTLEFFRRHLPALAIQRHPIYWLKSDNVGVIPDAARGPRRVVETALIASLGDRKIIKPVSNGYSSPTDKSIHQSTKPEPMLKHFFQMFVDDNTTLLDPTAGSGSALRAAEAMGAELVVGLEVNSEHCEAANLAVQKARRLREFTK